MPVHSTPSQHPASAGWSAKDVKTMSVKTVRPRKMTGFVRSQLAALLVLLFTTAMAPQAVAQVCGPNISLTADEWSMVGIPCVPGASNTVDGVFGPSFTGAYGVTWIVWKRVYDDPGQCTVASGPDDCYIQLAATDTVNTGDAFWMFTTEAVTLDMSAIGASATPGPNYDFPATLSPDGSSRYYMFANGYNNTVEGPDLAFPLIIFGFFTFVADTQQAIDNSILSRNAHYWNGNTYFTEDLTTTAATFTPKEAAWFEFLQPPSWITDVNVRVPGP